MPAVSRFATSLAARHGILWVARWDLGWRVVPHDFDGRELAAGFVVPPEDGTRVDLRSITVDEDRRVWIVDSAANRVRAFTAFGGELAGLPRGTADAVGSFANAVAVDATGVEEDARIAVASSGARKHALHLVRPDARAAVSLQPRDKSEGFAGLGRIAFGPRGILLACEPTAGLVHVWRDGRFHFAFRLPDERERTAGRAPACEPTAVRALADGRIVVASTGDEGGALHLFDGAGRLVRRLADGGDREGALLDPEDIALAETSGPDRRTRVVVADLAGSRLQVFNLEGDCYGAFGNVVQPLAERGDERAAEPT